MRRGNDGGISMRWYASKFWGNCNFLGVAGSKVGKEPNRSL